jgi:hypothetical protein
MVLRGVSPVQGYEERLVLQVWYYAQAVAFQKELEVTNKPKNKGTKAETDVVCWAKKHGLYQAERLALKGAGDVGDVRLTQGVMAQVKDGYTERKEPTDYQIGTWLEQVDKQTKAGGWDIGLLVHKRWGKADPDLWRWYMAGETFALLLGFSMGGIWPQYVQLQGYMVPPLIRGYT